MAARCRKQAELTHEIAHVDHKTYPARQPITNLGDLPDVDFNAFASRGQARWIEQPGMGTRCEPVKGSYETLVGSDTKVDVNTGMVAAGRLQSLLDSRAGQPDLA